MANGIGGVNFNNHNVLGNAGGERRVDENGGAIEHQFGVQERAAVPILQVPDNPPEIPAQNLVQPQTEEEMLAQQNLRMEQYFIGGDETGQGLDDETDIQFIADCWLNYKILERQRDKVYKNGEYSKSMWHNAQSLKLDETGH